MLPRIISEGKTPEQWVAELAGHGVEVSERALRARARETGACKMLGKAMILLPEHIDQIFEEPTCRSNLTSEATPGGLEDARLMMESTSERVLERLTKLSRKRPAARSSGRRGNVVSLDPTRRNPKTS